MVLDLTVGEKFDSFVLVRASFRCKPQAGFKFTVILHYLPKYGKAVPPSPTRGLSDQRLQTSLEETILPNAYGDGASVLGKARWQSRREERLPGAEEGGAGAH